MRRRALMAASMQSGGGITFPAVLVPHTNNEVVNSSNLAIVEYFLQAYPNMIVSTMGRYTPTTEDVYIQGSTVCDGKVIGVAKWSNSTEYIALLFYTSESISNFHSFKVIVKDASLAQGNTSEWFYD